MPDTPAPKEFLIVSVPDGAEPGSTFRLLAATESLASARKAVEELDSGVTGKIAVLERKALFRREVAVKSIELESKVTK